MRVMASVRSRSRTAGSNARHPTQIAPGIVAVTTGVGVSVGIVASQRTHQTGMRPRYSLLPNCLRCELAVLGERVLREWGATPQALYVAYLRT